MTLSEISLEDVRFEYEFFDRQGFECHPDNACGKCCAMPFNVTCSEITQINNFLQRWLQSSEFKDFVLDHVTYLRVPLKFTKFFLEKTYEKYRRAFEFFFKPAFFIGKNSTLYVTAYRFSLHKATGQCIFFNPMTYQCLIYSTRPLECRIYPFNFEYDFSIDKTIKVFIVEKCAGLESAKLIDKSSLENSIKESITMLFEHNKMLQKCCEKSNITLSLPYGSLEKREITSVQKEFAKVSELIEKIDVHDKISTTSMILDPFLEQQLIPCLNSYEYKLYLSQVQKKRPITSDWV